MIIHIPASPAGGLLDRLVVIGLCTLTWSGAAMENDRAPKAEEEPPVIGEQPIGRVVTEGGHAALSVRAQGTTPLSYQWWRNGEPLTNHARVTGATGAVLNIDPVLSEDTGDYSTVVSSTGGAVTSAVVSLVVNQLLPVLSPLGTTGVLVRVSGQRGDVYRIEASVNFGPWLTNGYATNLNGQAQFIDVALSGVLQRFRAAFDRMLPILEPAQGPGGPARFRAYGKLNQVWRIDGTTNLAQWEPLATVTNLTGWITFIDPAQPLPARRFYRIAPP